MWSISGSTCEGRGHAVLRFRASRGTPTTAVRSGILLEFPSPWSATTVRWSVPAFLLLTPGGDPAAPADVRSRPHAPCPGETGNRREVQGDSRGKSPCPPLAP